MAFDPPTYQPLELDDKAYGASTLEPDAYVPASDDAPFDPDSYVPFRELDVADGVDNDDGAFDPDNYIPFRELAEPDIGGIDHVDDGAFDPDSYVPFRELAEPDAAMQQAAAVPDIATETPSSVPDGIMALEAKAKLKSGELHQPESVDEAGFLGKTWESIKRSGARTKLLEALQGSGLQDDEASVQELYKVINEYDAIAAKDPIKAENLLGKWWYSAMNSVGAGMLRSTLRGLAIDVGTSAVLGAVTPPGVGTAAMLAKTAGRVKKIKRFARFAKQALNLHQFGKMGKGEMMMAMIEKDIDPALREPISTVGGIIYGAIENLGGIHEFNPVTKFAASRLKSIVADSTIKAVGKGVMDYGIEVVKESFEEFLQEGVSATATNIAIQRQIQSDLVDGIEKRINNPEFRMQSGADILARSWDAFKQSIGPMLILGAPSGATTTAGYVSGANAVKNDSKQDAGATTPGQARQEEPVVAPPASADIQRVNKFKASGILDAGVEVAPDTEQIMAVRDIVQQATGKHAVFVRGWDKANGAIDPNQPDTVFISTDAELPLLNIGLHEPIHQIFTEHAQQRAEGVEGRTDAETLLEIMQEVSPERYAAWQEKTQSLRATHGEDALDSASLAEEFIASFIGEQATNQGFWTTLYEKSPTAFQKILDIVDTVLISLNQVLTPEHYQVESVFNNVEALQRAQDIASGVLSGRTEALGDTIDATEEVEQVEQDEAFDPETYVPLNAQEKAYFEDIQAEDSFQPSDFTPEQTMELNRRFREMMGLPAELATQPTEQTAPQPAEVVAEQPVAPKEVSTPAPAPVEAVKKIVAVKAEPVVKRKVEKKSVSVKKIAPVKKAKKKPAVKRKVEKEVDPLRAAVMEEGGIKQYKVDPSTGKRPLAEEMRSLPLRFRRKAGMPLDLMLENLKERGVIDNDATESDLIAALQGERKAIEEPQTIGPETPREILDARMERGTKFPQEINEAEMDVGDLVLKNGEWMRAKDNLDGGKDLKDGETIKLDEFEGTDAALLVKKGDAEYKEALKEYKKQETQKAKKKPAAKAVKKKAADGELFAVERSAKPAERGMAKKEQVEPEQLLGDLGTAKQDAAYDKAQQEADNAFAAATGLSDTPANRMVEIDNIADRIAVAYKSNIQPSERNVIPDPQQYAIVRGIGPRTYEVIKRHESTAEEKKLGEEYMDIRDTKSGEIHENVLAADYTLVGKPEFALKTGNVSIRSTLQKIIDIAKAIRRHVMAFVFAFGEALSTNKDAYNVFMKAYHKYAFSWEKAANEVSAIIQKHGKISIEESNQLAFALEERGGVENLDKKLVPLYEALKEFRDQVTQKQIQIGVLKNNFPASAITARNEEITRLQNKENPASGDAKRLTELEKELEQLSRIEAYMPHGPVANAVMKSIWEAKGNVAKEEMIAKLKTSHMQRGGTLRLRDYLDAEIIKPEDIDVIKMMMGMGADAYQKIALKEVLDHGVANGFIVDSIPKDDTADWSKISDIKALARIKGLENKYIHPMFAAGMIELAGGPQMLKSPFDKVLAITKAGQFFRPSIIWTYNILQRHLRGMGEYRPWVAQKNYRQAWQSLLSRNEDWAQMAEYGLFQTPNLPTETTGQQMLDTMARQLRSDVFGTEIMGRTKAILERAFGQKFTKEEWAAKGIHNKVLDALMIPYRGASNVTWYYDNIQRMISVYNLMGQGWDMKDAVDYAAKAHGGYSLLGPKYKKLGSRIFFVHTFRLLMPLEMLKSYSDFGVMTAKAIIQKTKGEYVDIPAHKLRTAAKALGAVVAIPMAVHAMMTNAGWEPDEAEDEKERSWFSRLWSGPMKLHWKYRKQFVFGGKKREAVMGVNYIANMFSKWDARLFRPTPHRLDNKFAGLASVMKWEIHPTYRIILDILDNQNSFGGEQPRDLKKDITGQLFDSFKYAFGNSLRIYGDVLKLTANEDGYRKERERHQLKTALTLADRIFATVGGYAYTRTDKRKRAEFMARTLKGEIGKAKAIARRTYKGERLKEEESFLKDLERERMLRIERIFGIRLQRGPKAKSEFRETRLNTQLRTSRL